MIEELRTMCECGRDLVFRPPSAPRGPLVFECTCGREYNFELTCPLDNVVRLTLDIITPAKRLEL